MQPTPSLGTAYHLVAEDEQQRAISGTKRPTDATAFQAYVPPKKEQNQTQSRFKPKDGKRNGGEHVEHCDFCGENGHNKEGCFKRIGYPEWWPGKGKQERMKPKAACVEGETTPIPVLSDSQYQQFVKLFGNIKEETKE
ncbi:hypothetical protein HanIR_Chr08g0359701 [Helianthus annuus]|nr:hypothetical protein HanIR_Chr08g0359701 [Helianthus annuus]